MCGTAQWEWDKDPQAYAAVAHTCEGCRTLNYASQGMDNVPGVTMQLMPAAQADAWHAANAEKQAEAEAAEALMRQLADEYGEDRV